MKQAVSAIAVAPSVREGAPSPEGVLESLDALRSQEMTLPAGD